ncbi:MAG: GNAT family N-acetyltransferase [Promethearchaeota archaeon]
MFDKEVIIRFYSEDDEKYVNKLMQDLCATYNVEFDEQRWRRSLENKIKNSDSTKMLVAELEQKVIGMLVADIRRTNGRTGYISNLIVFPEYRNIGVGEKLIKSAIDFFKKNHISIVKVNVRAKAKSAKRLFVKLGFLEHIVQFKKDL